MEDRKVTLRKYIDGKWIGLAPTTYTKFVKHKDNRTVEKVIEDIEKSLNENKNGIDNLNKLVKIKPTPKEIGASDTSLLLNNRQFFLVEGEANKYYPVVIKCGSDSGTYGAVKVSISRGYSSQAPDSWNTPTHKGGLTLTVLMTGDYYWGGNDQSIQVLRFEESYSKMVGGMQMSTDGLVVWLRGGGAKYCLTSEYGQSASASVKMGKYVDIAKQEFDIRNDTSKVSSEILPLYNLRKSGIFDMGNRVYSPINKPTANEIGAVSKNGDTILGDLVFDKNRCIVTSNNYGIKGMLAKGGSDYMLYMGADDRIKLSYSNRPVDVQTKEFKVNGQAVTTVSDFLKYPDSTGYQKLPSGLIIQWGKVTKSINGGEDGNYYLDVVFPVVFPHTCLCAVGTPLANKYDIGKIKWFCQTDEYNYYENNNKYATFRVGVQTTGGATTMNINWIAIGY
ncbi:hypothetical protein N2W52_001902 [Clostridium perfringens]|nr:hypothetical protein [Clostridium perfringens]MDK0982914.1 hypothetical protein [Clostridium perfringens]